MWSEVCITYELFSKRSDTAKFCVLSVLSEAPIILNCYLTDIIHGWVEGGKQSSQLTIHRLSIEIIDLALQNETMHFCGMCFECHLPVQNDLGAHPSIRTGDEVTRAIFPEMPSIHMLLKSVFPFVLTVF